MNTERILFTIACAIVIVTTPGCLEHKITTTVNADGSCERKIAVQSDNDSLPALSYPLQRDGSWNIEKGRPDTAVSTKKKYSITATKRFQSVEDLNKEYEGSPDSKKLQVSVSCVRRFRWFYTYLRYTETYQVHFPYVRLPFAPYLTEDEVRRYQNGEKSDTLEKKAKAWYQHCLFEDFYSQITDAANRLGDSSMTVALLNSHREAIYDSLIGQEKGGGSTDDVINQLLAILKTKAVQRLRAVIDSASRSITEKEGASIQGGDDYNNAVIMPGLILETNTVDISGNKATWRTSSDRLKLRPFEMSVESRIVNTWAFVVTGIGLLLLVVGITVLGYRAKRS
jgi:hypothetical protein